MNPIISTRAKLTADEMKRYARQIVLPDIGIEGQERIKAAKVLLVGAGGLGSPVALYLTAAGVGTIGMVDFDTVELSNLQRQVIHTSANVGKSKLVSASEKLKAIHPNLRFIPYDAQLTQHNAFDIIRDQDYDVVVDGTDNFATRYLVNDACAMLRKPNVYGSISRFEGQATVFAPHLGGPCYRCLYPEPPPPGMVPSCAEGGVLGVICGVIGNIQATETLKLILGKGQALIGRLLLYDALEMKFREIKLRRDPQCPLCGEHPTMTQLVDYAQFCGSGRSNDAQSNMTNANEITPKELKSLLDTKENVLLVDVRERDEWEICRIEPSVLMPLSEWQNRWHTLKNESRPIVLICHHGARSMRALQFLQKQGITVKMKNLMGGINAWAEEIEPEMPRY